MARVDPLRATIVCAIVILLMGMAAGSSGRLSAQRLAQFSLCALGSCSPAGCRAGQPLLNPPRPAAHRALRTVFLIVLENHNWSSFKGSPSTPYLNHTLLPMASHAERYYNPPGLHPSLPNYLWLEAGTNCGIADDNPPSINHLHTSMHLVTLLGLAGISWRSYQEDIDGRTCPLTAAYPYAPKHNPFVYFDDVTNGNDPHSATCIARVRPYRELASDLQHNRVARYDFITPNLCDDGHDSCAPLNDPIKQTDSWLARAVPPILRSSAYRQGGVLLITWDEGEGGSDGPIGLLVLSRYAKGHGYAGTTYYTHSATLRTLEEVFGVAPLLGDAAHSADLRDLFTTFP